MEKTAAISAAKLAAKVGRVLPVIIDEIGEADEDGSIGATGRSQADAPEIDGQRIPARCVGDVAQGDIVNVEIEDADEHDLFGVISRLNHPRRLPPKTSAIVRLKSQSAESQSMSDDTPLPTGYQLSALDPTYRETPWVPLDRLRAADPVHHDQQLGRYFLTRGKRFRSSSRTAS